MWLYAGLVSAVLLGFYDVSRKHALNHNAVLPVLFLSVTAGFIGMLVLFGVSRVSPEAAARFGFVMAPSTLSGHLHILLKSFIVSSSWILAFFAMKHLPISIAAPIRASEPLWTLIAAVLFLHERPAPMQWVGMLTVFVSYYIFSLLGKKEGVVFHRSGWVLAIFGATLIGTGSVLYDRYLLHTLHYTPAFVQFWYSLYNVILIGIFTAVVWWPRRAKFTKFEWRRSIPLIGVFLLAADFVYFHAIGDPDALVGVLTVIRRSNVIVAFAVGALLFSEANIRQKAYALAGVLAGVILIVLL